VYVLGRLLGAAFLAAVFSIVGTILVFVVDDPCGCAQPSDDCGLAYIVAGPILLGIGFVLLFPVWAASLNARLGPGWRLLCGVIATALVLGAALGYVYYEAQQPPPPHQLGC
jgi:hypothetical protein